MAAARPFASEKAMGTTADVIWSWLAPADWLEAFSAHPRIGASPAAGPSWSAQEQAGASAAPAPVKDRLAQLNREYEARFGYIFIVCATGRSADEMMTILERRLHNHPDDELRVAADEQRLITRLRLAKLLVHT